MRESENFEIEYSEYALEFLEKADRQLKKRILKKVNYLAKNFDKLTHFPLTHEARDFFKLRVGKYRVIYFVDWKTNKIKIALIDRRDKVYKILKHLINGL
jgi:mRNA interferase RelE/StbE